MVLHVVICGKCVKSPPTRQCLLRALRQHSPRSYHATRSYLWTEENIFTSLTPVDLSDLNFKDYLFYAFRADMLCGGNNDDIRVIMMILLDLTSAVDGLVALATEDDDNNHNFVKSTNKAKEYAETNVLLVELADVFEKSEESQKTYLRRWGVNEDDYHYSMARRVMLMSGGVYALPLTLQHSFPTQKSAMEFPLALLSINKEARERCREATATEALHLWSNKVARVMREESWHLVVVAVPAAVVELLDVHPRLLHAALLHHVVRRPLTWPANGEQKSTSPCQMESCVRGVVQEYRTLIQNISYVRLPLRMPRYIFAHFFHASLPPFFLMTEPLVQMRSQVVLPAADSDVDVVADEKELLLGLQLTIALHRLRLEEEENHGPHKRVIEHFLKEVQRESEGSLVGACELGDVFSQVRLNNLRRKVMPVGSLRSDSIDWMHVCARDAALECSLAEKDLSNFDNLMLNYNDSSTAVSFGEGDDCESESSNKSNEDDDDDVACHYDGDCDLSEQLKEIECFMETQTHEAVLGDSGDDEAALCEVADNALFQSTVQMLALQ